MSEQKEKWFVKESGSFYELVGLGRISGKEEGPSD